MGAVGRGRARVGLPSRQTKRGTASGMRRWGFSGGNVIVILGLDSAVSMLCIAFIISG